MLSGCGRATLERISGYFCNEMRYINLRFTYLLTITEKFQPQRLFNS